MGSFQASHVRNGRGGMRFSTRERLLDRGVGVSSFLRFTEASTSDIKASWASATMPADPGAGLASLRLIRLRRLRFYRGGGAKAAGQHNDQNRSHWVQFADLCNGAGAAGTGAALCVILSTKFVEGARIIVLVIPCVLALLKAIKHYYRRTAARHRAGPLPLLRHCDDARWLRDGRAHCAPDGAANKGRGQSRSSGEPRCGQCESAGVDPDAL